jgi:riboflavin kinase/FMN adenylyltransferase
MQIIEWPQFLQSGLSLKEKQTSMTVGVFDGVHRGHQALIERVVSHNAEYVPVVITFRENHKRDTVKTLPEKETHAEAQRRKEEGLRFSDILTFEERAKVLADMGVQILLVVDFTESFRNMSGIEFLEILMERGNVGFFAVGSNFRCGRNLDTDAAAIGGFFSSRGVPFETAPEVMEGGLPISSSRIRAALAAGDIGLAEEMLGRQY